MAVSDKHIKKNNKSYLSIMDIYKHIMTILVTTAMSMMLIACHPSYVNAQNELEALLNSEEGQKMTADELAEMTPDFADKLRGTGCDIHLPLTEVHTLPKAGQLYVSSLTGSSMIFHQNDSIVTVTIALREDRWGMPADSLEGMAQYIVMSCGKSLYTLYNNKEARWEGKLLYVYPDADSIIVTHGCQITQQTFYRTATDYDDITD